MTPKLIALYQQMSDLTGPECGQCRAPYSCCDPMYCDMATERAAVLGVTLTRGNHPTLPYMLEGVGCTVPPYVRMLCTLHTCDICSLGFKRGDARWTEQYYILRDQIDKLEWSEDSAAANGERTA